MSTKDPNMKVIIGADTKDFDKGAKNVKQGLNDLDKVGGQALDALGNAFGVNVGKISQMTSALKGLGTKMSEAGSAGVSAFGKILSAIGPVGTAIAGLGIGTAIAGFRSLKEEAEAFKNTVAGANIEMATAAYIGTYKQVLNDFRADSQKALAETESRMKGFWGSLGASFKAYIASGGLAAAEVPGASADNYLTQISAAADSGEKARGYAYQIYELERKRKEQAVDLAKINDEIAGQLQIAKDATKSTAERSAAIVEAEALLAQKKTMTLDLETKLAELYENNSALAEDSPEDADALLAQKARVYEADRAIKLEEMSISKVKNSILKTSEAETAEYKKQQAIIEKENLTMLQYLAKRIEMNDTQAAAFSNLPTLQGMAVAPMTLSQKTVDEFKSRLIADMGEITLYVGFKTDTQKVQDITNEVTSLLQSGVARTGEIIGNLIGTLAGGGDAWGDFKNAALSAFGDMAIAIGKIAISAGLASSGIAAALKNPENWMLAVAAGAALVALGAAVKSSLSAVASGDYSAGGGGYSGGYASGSSSDFETREVQVYVTGTLEADGDKLITVINNTNKKNYYTQ